MATLDEPPRPARAAVFDEALNLAALRLMQQLHDGRVAPADAGYELSHRRAPVDFDTMLDVLAASPDVGATLAALEPRSSQYRALQRALARYRGIPENFAASPAAGLVRAGDAYAGAASLRRRLEELGDADPVPDGATVPGAVYDDALAAAVGRFQRRHGLRADGVLGPRTRAELSGPASTRVRQIELTMERWRWLPDLRAPAVIVNVPQYMLYTLPEADLGDAAPPQKIPVIVGKLQTMTPVFDSLIEAVIFRPWWEVPRDIVRGGGETPVVLPADAAGIAALRAGRARLRQRPGPRNSLGLIKFVLPNRHAVYLHSTPEAALFASDRRAYSHGCIRVSDPTALAAYLLRGTPGNWTADAIEAATCGSETLTVRLAKPVPVYILYGTAVADGGQVLFFEDVYGYDRKLAALLSRAGGAAASRAFNARP
jgi:murein L,D-transpeptidase YcbB/YkuD